MPIDLIAKDYGVDTDVNKAKQVTTEGVAATYGVSEVAIVPFATPTDLVVLTGSATKTGRVKHICVSGIATTAGSMDVSLVKHTVADTAGTKAAAPGIAKFDSTDAAASCAVNRYTAAPTVDASGVILATKTLNFGVAGAAGQVVFDFATRNDKAVILRGVAQELAINLNGQALPAGGKITYAIEWEEDAS